MRYRRELMSHLDAMPDPRDLDSFEKRQVGDDLAHYARILQGAQETSLREAWIALAGSGASLLTELYLPGAEIFLLAVAAGFGLVALRRAYDIKRREHIVTSLIKKVDDISWALKR